MKYTTISESGGRLRVVRISDGYSADETAHAECIRQRRRGDLIRDIVREEAER